MKRYTDVEALEEAIDLIWHQLGYSEHKDLISRLIKMQGIARKQEKMATKSKQVAKELARLQTTQLTINQAKKLATKRK